MRGVPESVTDLLPAVQRLFQSLRRQSPVAAFSCDRIHRALRPKPPEDKPPRDIVLCLKDYLVKEEILRASRNISNILLDVTKIQIYPDISPATLDKHRKMKEITSVLQSVRILYRWGFPFKLQVPHERMTYNVTTIPEGKELLVKLGLPAQENVPRMPSTPRRQPSGQHPYHKGSAEDKDITSETR